MTAWQRRNLSNPALQRRLVLRCRRGSLSLSGELSSAAEARYCTAPQHPQAPPQECEWHCWWWTHPGPSQWQYISRFIREVWLRRISYFSSIYLQPHDRGFQKTSFSAHALHVIWASHSKALSLQSFHSPHAQGNQVTSTFSKRLSRLFDKALQAGAGEKPWDPEPPLNTGALSGLVSLTAYYTPQERHFLYGHPHPHQQYIRQKHHKDNAIYGCMKMCTICLFQQTL